MAKGRVIMSDVKCELACIVVTYNGAPWLQQCLDSIAQSTVDSRIIVVDNNSTDDTVQIARSHSDLELIEMKANLGFGRANNIGIARALDMGAKHVLILNQDALLARDTLELLIKASEQQPDAGILCPMQLNADGTALDADFLRYYIALHGADMLNDALLGRPIRQHYTVEAAPAAAWLFKKDLLLKVGGFDPLFFMYCEDDDLCRRARHHGYNISVVPGALFYHCRGFHGLVHTESKKRKIQRRSSRLRSILIRDVKRPDGRIWMNTWHGFVECGLAGLTALVSHRNWVEAVATVIAMLRCLVELPEIARHRRQCLGTGSHWLPVSSSASPSVGPTSVTA